MKVISFFFLFIVLPFFSSAQWQKIKSPSTYTANFLVKHKDKAYASLQGVLCVGDREDTERYAFYPIDASNGQLRSAASLGDYFIVGNNVGTLTAYSDVSIAQKSASISIGNQVVTKITTRDNVILAGSYNGIFRSTDTLKTLVKTNDANFETVNDIVWAADKWFAATDKGLFSSSDSGISWDSLSLGRRMSNSIAYYGDSLYVARNNGLFVSADLGKSWDTISFFKNQITVRLVVEGDILYLFTDNGLFMKNDTGTWIEIQPSGLAGQYTGLIQLGRTRVISSYWGISFQEDGDPNWHPILTTVSSGEASTQSLAADETYLLTGTDTRGVFASINKGVSWQMKSPPFHFGSVYGTGHLSILDEIWFVSNISGLYRSMDKGNTWHLQMNGLNKVGNFYVNSLFKSGNHLLLGNEKGLYYSVDGGDNWQRPTMGIDTAVSGLCGTNTDKLFAATPKGVYVSIPPYNEWMLQSSPYFVGLASLGDTLYGASYSGGAYRSFDGGKNWIEINKGLANKYVRLVLSTSQYALSANGVGEIYIRGHADTTWYNFNGNLDLVSGVSDMLVLKDTVYVSTGIYGIYRRSLKDFQSPLGLGQEEYTNRELSFYPNPASETIFFKTLESYEQVEIVDINGQTLLTSSVQTSLSIEKLNKGIYLVKSYMKDGKVKTEKLIKI